jgi:hypothetical protein
MLPIALCRCSGSTQNAPAHWRIVNPEPAASAVRIVLGEANSAKLHSKTHNNCG